MEDFIQSTNICNDSGPANYDHFFKILLVGDACVGKTSLLIRFCEDTYSPSYHMTIGIDFRSKIVTTEGSKERIKLQLWVGVISWIDGYISKASNSRELCE